MQRRALPQRDRHVIRIDGIPSPPPISGAIHVQVANNPCVTAHGLGTGEQRGGFSPELRQPCLAERAEQSAGRGARELLHQRRAMVPGEFPLFS